MYSFESTNDFGHKIGYVSSITHPSDGLSEEYYPLEQIYLFDDLFVRFQSEIEHAHSTNTYFNSGWLKVCGVLSNNVQSSSYFFVRVGVDNNGDIRVYYGWGSEYPTNPDYDECTKSQYQNHEYQYTYGRIYLLNEIIVNSSTGQPNGYERYLIKFGVCAINIGTWYEPSSTWPYGHMYYQLTDQRTLPEFLPVGSIEQCGYPSDNTAVRSMQPEAGVTQMIGSGGSSRTSFYRLCSAAGEYDPDPDPPGPTPPGPGPGPSGDDPNDRDPEPSDKESTDGGPHTPHNDPLPIPGLPGAGAVSGGAFNVFKLTANEFNAFNGELYSDNAWTALKNYFNDPLDFMIGCIMVPVIAQSLGVLHPKFNSYVWSQAYARVIEQYVELDCGSIVCRAYYGSCFDYSPYTKVQLFLPFIGYVDLDPDEIMDMAVSIKYHIDVCTGDCVAFVSSALVSENARVIGQYNGNCGTQIPITRSNYDNVIAAGMNLLAASASAVGTYRAGGASIGAASLTGASDAAIAGREIGLNAHLSSQLGAATMSAMAGSKSSVSRNGTLGGTCGLMGMLKPHLLVHTPRQSKPSNYMEMRGYPSNIGGVVGDFEGYLEVMDVRLNDIPATIDEINEIYELLKGGIII